MLLKKKEEVWAQLRPVLGRASRESVGNFLLGKPGEGQFLSWARHQGVRPQLFLPSRLQPWAPTGDRRPCLLTAHCPCTTVLLPTCLLFIQEAPALGATSLS